MVRILLSDGWMNNEITRTESDANDVIQDETRPAEKRGQWAAGRGRGAINGRNSHQKVHFTARYNVPGQIR
jgi:hypothetical protein